MSKRRKSRELELFSLSFLDIISCGFGAVVLLVLISDYKESPVPKPDLQAAPSDAEIMDQEQKNSDLQKAVATARAALDELNEARLSLEEIIAEKSAQAESGQNQITKLDGDLAGLEKVKESLERASIRTQSPPPDARDDEVGGIPVDADHIIFIVDTSGSMKEVWGRVTQEMENILDIHPKVDAFQILNDNGNALLKSHQTRWIADNDRNRRLAIRAFKNWDSFSNSSPAEGLQKAFRRYVKEDGKRIGIYILGDDYSGNQFSPLLSQIDQLNTHSRSKKKLARIHALGFISSASTGRFTMLMREITRRNHGTLLLLDADQKFDPTGTFNRNTLVRGRARGD